MRIANITIENFRGIKTGNLNLSTHSVLVGDNNSCKSTVIEAIDLVLGADRLSKNSVIDEHDFYAGEYLNQNNEPVEISVVVTVVDLNEEQQTHFRNNLEFWDKEKSAIITSPPPERTDEDKVIPALRVAFRGYYDKEEDDFTSETYFYSPVLEDGKHDYFTTKDKRLCGFLYLRTLRTGSRALSLGRGSLLDIILKLRELKPQMWEDVLLKLRELSVAGEPELGIADILTSVQDAVRKIVPMECADAPTVRVSQLTREHLREVLTVFMGTGAKNSAGKEYAAPFHHQGTGTINTLVLTLLSMIAELKQNVIFAMEEPEIAIPPHTQKRVIKSVAEKATQAIFTSHSPYVLEEFRPEDIVVIEKSDGVLSGKTATYPTNVKPKKFREETRRRCEALLARRVLIVEGRTEYDTFARIADKLEQNDDSTYSSLESMGIAVISADTDSQIAPLGDYFKSLGKTVYAIFDKQSPEALSAIVAAVDHPFESCEDGFENTVLKGLPEDAVRRFATELIDRGKLVDITPESEPIEELRQAMMKCLKKEKGAGTIADFLESCEVNELPFYITETLSAIHDTIPVSTSTENEEAVQGDDGDTAPEVNSELPNE